jgi:heme-degrading monooxygenase HmoA
MIARIWRGWTLREDADAYVEYLQQTGAPASLGTPGNRGFTILHRPDGEREEFLTISLWDSLEVVRGFAGDDIEKAVFYPEDDAFLVDREWTAAHFAWITGRDPVPEE